MQTHDFTEKLSPGSVLLFDQTCLFSRFVRDFLTYLAMRLSIILFFVYLIKLTFCFLKVFYYIK